MHVACSEEPVVRIGDVAQDFTLPSLTGEQISLSQFKGKNVFIFFWTQGCVFCQTDNIVHVNDIFLKGKRKDLIVFSINIAEPKGDVREFVKQKGLIFPVLLDRDAKVTRKKYGVYMVPTLSLSPGKPVRQIALPYSEKHHHTQDRDFSPKKLGHSRPCPLF
jgi:peroxiredoxin